MGQTVTDVRTRLAEIRAELVNQMATSYLTAEQRLTVIIAELVGVMDFMLSRIEALEEVHFTGDAPQDDTSCIDALVRVEGIGF